MKKVTIAIFTCLISLWGINCPAMAQMMYKGQFYINELRFHRSGQLLHITLRISYDKGVVNANESLLLTPVIKSRENVAYFSSVAINGSEREKAEHRADYLQDRRRINIPVMVMENRKGTKSFAYETSIPYAEWMKDGQFYIETEECSYNGHKNHLYEDLLLTQIPIENQSAPVPEKRPVTRDNQLSDEASRFAQWVEFIIPDTRTVKNVQRSGVIYWNNNRKNRDKMKKQKLNNYICEYLNDEIRAMQQEHYDARLSHITVTGYGVPIGKPVRNEKQSMRKALSLKNELSRNLSTDPSQINASWITEDWDSIVSLIGQRDLPLGDAIIDIIRTIKVSDGRERVLKRLNNGMPYTNLRAYIFPQVPRLKYTLTFSLQATDEATARLTWQKNQENMTLADFYALIHVYEPGTREFNDLVDLAARLFPDNPEANINAAAVALTHGDTDTARSYLTRWQTDARAYNNMGILYLLEDNRDKAEVYLEMARAAGVRQAGQALSYLNKHN